MSEKRQGNISPVTLESIWEVISNAAYLKDLGCNLSPGNGPQYLKVRGVDGIPEGTFVTVDRKLYDRGGSNMEGRLHFASYGDPVFEGLMDEFQQYDLPPYVVRLTENVPELDVEVVAYAAAGMSEKGLSEVRLIASLKDLDGFILNEAAELFETQLEPLRKKLHNLVRQEFDPTRAVTRLEKQNKRAGLAQNVMNLLTIRKLLPPPGHTDADNFWSTVKDRLDPLIEKRERLMVPDMPVNILTALRDELPYELDLPRVGEKTVLTLPIYAVAAGVDAACRLADSMRKKKSDLTISMVQARLDREIEKELKVYKRFFA